MCGRARCSLRADDIPRACHRIGAAARTVDMERYRPSYNVSPGAYLPVVRREDGGNGESYAIHCMRWGLIPSFTNKNEKPDFYRMFNARSESVGEKASFRRLLPKSRCLVAVEGFYEWKKDGTKKQPYYIHFKDDRPLVFAALYDSWKNSEGEILYTFTILTTSASSALQWLHDRMPVILGDKGAVDTWLNDSPSSKIDTVLKPYENSELVWYPVTPAMGKTSFNGPECIKEIKLKEDDRSSISKFFIKKEIKEEPTSRLERSTCETVGKEDPPERVKQLPESQDKTVVSPFITSEDLDFKSSIYKPSLDEEPKNKAKRDREELLAGSDASTDENKQLHSGRAKKANLTSGDDQQRTLFSYFGRK
ncbi:hypothetical protein K2173_018334 [Erythroxylum novogranatense]|uniref:Embryonic stem cell-specific 5-hydroxymethylcytosine-binding protein n=1 Tax=Erythroxylum novogranatense TaxID=1862640 RepID=A0AAV8UAB1_9ROSI|nr:hypothetical protein K2173_018334 [Erythroxylum novogranatense]